MNKYSFNKALIICPHADDELFTLSFIYSRKFTIHKTDMVILDRNNKRLLEAKKSSEIHNFDIISVPKSINIWDGHFHDSLKDLIKLMTEYRENYDLILSPMIEGGHQDHDTTTLSLLLSEGDKSHKNNNIFLYPCYTNTNKFPWIYRCGISKSSNSLYKLYFKMPSNWFIIIFKTVIFAYKSQIKTWLLLLPAITFAYLRGEMNYLIKADKSMLNYLLGNIPNVPLYEIYRGFKKEQWENIIKPNILKL